VAQQGVFPFFSLLASISLALAIFNLLPIPPFDGFHMAFTASNWILGGRVPYQVMNGISLIGILFFVCFFLFISWQDIFCT
jgi:regulator of sigma E protease